MPAIVQDAVTKDILMLGFLNDDAWQKTLATGRMWYFSRKRRKLWMKGEQSGHIQIVKEIRLDCDNDCLLIQVEQLGGACDQGYRSCFDKRYVDGEFVLDAVRVFEPSSAYPLYSEQLAGAVPLGSLAPQISHLLQSAQLDWMPQDSASDRLRARLPGYKSDIVLAKVDPWRIPQLVEAGQLDLGVTGMDCLLESGVDLKIVSDLGFNKHGMGMVTWALAVPNDLPINTPVDLTNRTIYTRLPMIVQQFLQRNAIKAQVAPTGEGQLFETRQPIVDLIETGASLLQRGYRPLCPVLHTSTVIVANRQSYSYTWKRRRIEELRDRLADAASSLPANTKIPYVFTNGAFSNLSIISLEESTIG